MSDEYDYDNYRDRCKKRGIEPMNYRTYQQYQADIAKEAF